MQGQSLCRSRVASKPLGRVLVLKPQWTLGMEAQGQGLTLPLSDASHLVGWGWLLFLLPRICTPLSWGRAADRGSWGTISPQAGSPRTSWVRPQ